MKKLFTLILLLIFCWNGLSGEGCNRILSTIQTPTNWEFLRVPTATLSLFATSARHTLTHLGDEFGSVERRAVQQQIDRADFGIKSVGFSDPLGYELVTYEVLENTQVLKTKMTTNYIQYISGDLQNNVKIILKETTH